MLTLVHNVLEVIAGTTAFIAIILFIVGYLQKDRFYCLFSSKLLNVTALIWSINLLFEFLTGIYISAIGTVIFVVVTLYFANRIIEYSFCNSNETTDKEKAEQV